MKGKQGKPQRPVRVAIVGGGCAGLAAAWELSRQPGYQVSVYERSWRLGGKGASGRDEEGRIHEHGLHVWLGFYENAFRMIRECYEEVGRRKWGPDQQDVKNRLAHATFEDAFLPEPHIGVAGLDSKGQTSVWSGILPPEKGLPGDPVDEHSNPFTLASYLLRSVNLLKTLMLSVIGPPAKDVPGQPRPDGRSPVDEAAEMGDSAEPGRNPEIFIERIATRLRDGTLTVAAVMLQAMAIFETVLRDLNHSPQVAGSMLNLMEAFTRQTRTQLRDLVAIDEKLRWKTEIIDIVMTIVVGLYRDRVLLDEHGLDAINDLDYREWLRKHGATESALQSRFITGIYDLVFAYERGNRQQPKLAAGVALRGALRMFFTYRGSMFWRLRSGMGDAVFAPLYKVLTLEDCTDPSGEPLQPVRFHFRHELSGVTFKLASKERRVVTELRFTTTGHAAAIVNPGHRALDHFGCWPNDDHRLCGSSSERGTTVLRMHDDFDAVIFALGRDDLAALLEESAGSDDSPGLPPSWRPVRRPGETVATKAAQAWLTSDLEELGWHRGSGIITALNLTFDTWADMTHTLATEHDWRKARGQEPGEADRARSVAYFCGVLADPAPSGGGEPMNDQRVREQVPTMLEQMKVHWPASVRDEVRTYHIVARDGRANTSDEDRYALSLPGTIADRLSPLDPAVRNATVAGDWTACGLDCGCVEAAVMSGKLAAHAITGNEPRLESIVGYDHP